MLKTLVQNNYHVRAKLTSVFRIMSPARILSELVKVVLAEGICIEEVCLAVALAWITSRPETTIFKIFMMGN